MTLKIDPIHHLIRFLLLLLLVVTLKPLAFAHSYYNVGDPVPLYANKVGPLNNPSETYKYYDLPFCHPDQVVLKKETLGEILNGDRLTKTLYVLKFREEKSNSILCERVLKKDDIKKFRNAVNRDFYFQMYYDDLPLWGYIGKMEEVSMTLEGKGPKNFIFRHVHFDALYNGNQVLEINAFSDPTYAVDITGDNEINIRFTYSVTWKPTAISYGNRMSKYSKASFMPMHKKIHWFSFVNSAGIIVLLTGLLIVLFIRHLKNDLRKYSTGDEEEDKEVGWKYIHGDIFRIPPRMPLFCAVLGNGTHLLTIICLLFILAFLDVLYPYNRGVLSNSLVATYILTAPVAGYTATSFYGKFSEAGWERCVLLTGILYIGPLFTTLLVLNTVAISYGATAALPVGTIVVILLLYILIAVPLLAFGGLIGYRHRSPFQSPSATKRCPREIPSSAWYKTTSSQMLIGGLLPFSAIILELHQLYASIWSYKIFTMPSILFITFVILVLLSALLSMGLTYIQLTTEDHEWWWRSVFRGGSIAFFMLLYSIHFYAKSNMSGFLQLTFFFGYNACFCYAVFLMLGTIGFRASWIFVQHIYNAVKSE